MLQLDRPHRFEVGDRIHHVDSEEAMLIEACTLRIVPQDSRAYPTYTISSRCYGIKEFVEDVLDTEDLIKIEAIPTRIVGMTDEEKREWSTQIRVDNFRREIESGNLDSHLAPLARSIVFRQERLWAQNPQEPRASRR